MLVKEGIHLTDEAGKVALACLEVSFELLVLLQQKLVKFLLLLEFSNVSLISRLVANLVTVL